MVRSLVVDFEALRGKNKELLIKELAVAGKNFVQTYHFASPYSWKYKESDFNTDGKNGINFHDGYIPYSMLKTVIDDCVAGFTSLYSFGEDKCSFLSELTDRTFVDMEKEFRCPKPENLYHEIHCGFPCHKFSYTHCACKHANALYNWLIHHRLAKLNTKCPPDGIDRHDASFLSAI
jgi:hypothetical protein